MVNRLIICETKIKKSIFVCYSKSNNQYSKTNIIMSVGYKIKKLREQRRMSQPELAELLGVSQTSLSHIENGITKKLDFKLMDKICREFEVDFDYFIDDKQVNNIKKLDGSINNHGTINLFPENIIEQIKLLIEDNKQKDEIITELKVKLMKYEE